MYQGLTGENTLVQPITRDTKAGDSNRQYIPRHGYVSKTAYLLAPPIVEAKNKAVGTFLPNLAPKPQSRVNYLYTASKRDLPLSAFPPKYPVTRKDIRSG